MRVLLDVARDLTHLRPGARPSVALTAPHTYATTIPLRSVVETGDASSQFRLWLWYAARRAGLALDGGTPGPGRGDEASTAASDEVSELFGLSDEIAAATRNAGTQVMYSAGEVLHHAGTTSRGLFFVLDGRVQLYSPATADPQAVEAPIERGGYTGEACLAREPEMFTARALEETRLLFVPAENARAAAIAEPALARRLGAVSDARRRIARDIMLSPAARV